MTATMGPTTPLPTTEASAAAILAAVTAAEAARNADDDALQTLVTTISGYLDGVEGKLDTVHTDLAAVVAKLSSDPATQSTLAAVLAKLSSDPATQTTLAAVLAKLTSDPSTATLQTAANAKLDALHTDIATTLLGKNEAIRALLAGTLVVEGSVGDYTETIVASGPAAGLPATRTYTTGPLAGRTTTWTYDSTWGAVTSRVTA